MSALPTSGLFSKMLKVAKNVVLVVVLLTFVAIFYNYFNRYFQLKNEPLVKSAPVFGTLDVVKFTPVPGVTELGSDKTTDALLSGQFGPVVVVFVADWCGHCKNLSVAYESASKSSPIPFVRVQGQSVPVSSSKYGVAGYPTIFGLSSSGGPPRRFNGQRTVEALLEFANGLVGVVTPQYVPPQIPTSVVIAVPPVVAVGAEDVPSVPVDKPVVSVPVVPVQEIESTTVENMLLPVQLESF